MLTLAKPNFLVKLARLIKGEFDESTVAAYALCIQQGY